MPKIIQNRFRKPIKSRWGLGRLFVFALALGTVDATLFAGDAQAQCSGGTPDGMVTPAEDCDDNNGTLNDGCNATCNIENEWSCARVLDFADLDARLYPSATANWVIAGDFLSGEQTVNSTKPSVAIFGEDAYNGTYAVTMQVNTTSDDDFIGFALGFAAGDETNAAADWVLIDWKQALQSGVPPGIALSHVLGAANNGTHADHDIPQRTCATPGVAPCVTELTRGNSLGSTGWADNTVYTVYITYRPDRLIIAIDGVVEFDVTPSDFPGQFSGNVFPPGEIGFYTHSQEDVEFSNLAPFGPSICNLTTLTSDTIDTTVNSGSTVINVADYFSDVGDSLDAGGVVVLNVSAGATATDPQTGAPSGTIVLTPTDDNIMGAYTVTFSACDNDAVISDCDDATITVYYLGESDGDGVNDELDVDDDNDGLSDALETGNLFGSDDPGEDSDSDGIPNWSDVNYWTTDLGLPGDCPDSGPADGRCDSLPAYLDVDGDDLPNQIDRDSDGDGITDTREAGGVDANGNGIPDSCLPVLFTGECTAGTISSPTDTEVGAPFDYLDTDSDGDGILDRIEAFDTNGNGVINGAETAPSNNDSDGDGIDNAFDPDSVGSNPITTPLSSAENANGNGTPDWQETCVDGYITGSEACDDGNGTNTDNCTNACLRNIGVACTIGTQCVIPGVCDGTPDTCQICSDDGAGVTDTGCATPGSPACNATGATFTCVACTADLDCLGGQYCDGTLHVCLTPSVSVSAPSGTLVVDFATPSGSSGNAPVGTMVAVTVLNPDLITVEGTCSATIGGGGGWSCSANAISGLTDGTGYVTQATIMVGTAIANGSLLFNVDLPPCYALNIGDSCVDGSAGTCRDTGAPDLLCCTGCWTGSACVAGTSVNVCGIAGATCADCDDSAECTVDSCPAGACVYNSEPLATPCTGGFCNGGGGSGDACLLDKDSDFVEDAIDLDDDNDGIPDLDEVVELATDPSGDGNSNDIEDYRDATVVTCDDVNTDNICDTLPQSVDQDDDGIPNHLDLDADGDGIPDLIEGGGTDSDADGVVDGFTDVDTDGLDDTLEATPLALPNTDGDDSPELPDFLDIDADNDGLTDTLEAGGTDADGDGAPDGVTDGNNNGLADELEGSGNALPLSDSDDDDVPDYQSTDSDRDNIPDAQEGWDGDGDGDADVEPVDADSDGDGLDDAADPDCADPGDCADDVIGTIAPVPNTDGDTVPLPNFQDRDSDNDGIADDVECPTAETCLDADTDGTPDVLETDSDDDGIPDSSEGFDADHNGSPDVAPANADDNGNGLDDAYDPECPTIVECSGVVGVPAPLPDLDTDTVADYRDPDDDADGIDSAEEVDDAANCSGFATPCAPLLGGSEEDIDADGLPNWYDLDSDNDGVSDQAESNGPNDGDYDNNELPDYIDPTYQIPDTDGDGISDPQECIPPAFPFNNDCSDFDGDGAPDYDDPDDDNDGILTTDELAIGPDTDGDGVSNHLDRDSDNDGIPDLWENGGSDLDDNKDGEVDGTPTDNDGDGVIAPFDADDDDANNTDTSEPVVNTDESGPPDAFDLDSDDDGITDIVEANGDDDDNDGRVDDDLDSDQDGLLDAVDPDASGGTPWETPDTDDDGRPDFQDRDSDGDGLNDRREYHDNDEDGTSDREFSGEDVDGDGLDDAFDPDQGGTPATDSPINSDEDALVNYRDPDDDNDGVPTRDEDINGDGNRSNDDTDDDDVPNFLDPDDDGDGIPTVLESPDPNNDDDVDDAQDTDDDDIPDYLDTDDDGDSIPTEFEDADPNDDGDLDDAQDTDNDGIPDYLDTDDDGDGIPTIDEAPDLDGDGNPIDAVDVDNDGIPDYLDPDVQTGGGGYAGGALCSPVPGSSAISGAFWMLLWTWGSLLWRRFRRKE